MCACTTRCSNPCNYHEHLMKYVDSNLSLCHALFYIFTVYTKPSLLIENYSLTVENKTLYFSTIIVQHVIAKFAHL